MFAFVQQILLTFNNNTNISIIPTHLNIDCWYDFPHTQVNANQRNPEQIEVGNDNVHPNKYGYYRIADTILGDILATCN